MSRRAVLAGAGSALIAPRVLRSASASSDSDRLFLFIYALGGWDVTRVFAPMFSSPDIEMEADAVEATAGGITYVDHPDRPTVRSFFEAWHDRVAIINGVYRSSVTHGGALRTTMTGDPDGSSADWPTRIAAAQGERYLLPYLAVGGPYFSGQHGVYVCRAGSAGQLRGLANGEIVAASDRPITLPTSSQASRVDEWLRASADRRMASADSARAAQLLSWEMAAERGAKVKEIADILDSDGGVEFADQVGVAVRCLEHGVSRCASLLFPQQDSLTEWDTHALNDERQSSLFEKLFTDLDDLMNTLASTAGPAGGTLADQTTVVVMSEMGRTPDMNSTLGKDHWPYSSVLIMGAGVAGDQVVGGYDDYQYGLAVDLASGALDEAGGATISVDTIGATCVQLAGEDLGDAEVAASPLLGVIA